VFVAVLAVAVIAGCGGGNDSTTPSEPAATTATAVAAKSDDPLVRIALAAVRVVSPQQCARLYEGGSGVKLCEDYITAGSRQSQARPLTVTRAGAKAVVTVAEPGGNPVALLLRQSGGTWRVYDSPNLLPAAG
jgi:hypothetical protein